jgi:HD superfamily phosphohydrolase
MVQVAVLLHDIGTASFAHSYEGVLFSKYGWHHHNQIESIIYGTYRPENKDHQIYYGNQLRLCDILSDLRIDPKEIISTIRGEPPLGPLVNGTLDLDNIDNVLRMSAILGLGNITDSALRLGESLAAYGDSVSLAANIVPDLRKWQMARKRCYEVLALDHELLGAQAMLRECFELAVKAERLGPEHWHLTDNEMLRRLYSFDDTKSIIKRLTVGDYYQTLYLNRFEYDENICEILRNPDARSNLAERIEAQVEVKSISLFHLQDRGMFSKSLNIGIRELDGSIVQSELGEESKSLILSVLTRSKSRDVSPSLGNRLESVLESFGFVKHRNMVPDKVNIYAIDRQEKLQV